MMRKRNFLRALRANQPKATLKLKSSDGVIFPVDAKAMMCSNFIKNTLEILGPEDGEEITVPDVKSEILHLIVTWAMHHQDDLPFAEAEEELTLWDEKFLNTDDNTLEEVMKAANSLEMPRLIKYAKEVTGMRLKEKVRAGNHSRDT